MKIKLPRTKTFTFRTFASRMKIGLLLLLMNSCAFEDTIEPTFLVDLNTDIKVELLPDLYTSSANTQNFIWKISLNDIEACKDSELITTYTQSESEDRLYIEGLTNPTSCETGVYELYTSHNTEINSSEKAFKVILANVENNLQLRKRDNSILIEYETLSGLKLENQELLTIDQDYIWGGIYNSTEQDRALFFNLFQQISEEILYEPIPHGNYGYFKFGDITQVIHPQTLAATEYGFGIKIKEGFDWEMSQAINFLANFRMQHPELDFFVSDQSGKLY